MKIRSVSLCVLSLCCSAAAFGQNYGGGERLARDAGSPAPASFELQPQRPGLYRFYGVAEEVLALQDVQAKAFGAAQLADLLWKYDEPRSRQLFEKVLTLTGAEARPEERALYTSLRRSVLVTLARRDAAWAEHLIDAGVAAERDDASGWQSDTNLAVASALLAERPEAAVDFAARSLRAGVNPSLIWFLKDLRRTHEREADGVFLQSLARFAQQPAPDANGLALLGTYLFTSPRAAASDPTSVVITRVGNVGIIDITADQPGVSPALVRAFIKTSIAVLSRQIPDPHQRQLSYALGYLLLPKARIHAPELVAPLAASMSAVSAGVPAGMTQETAYANLSKTRPDDAEVMSNADKLSDPQARDAAYLDIAFHAWLRKDFAAARRAADRVEAREPRNALRVLVDFGEGAALLGEPARLPDAAAAAARLPQGVERAVLFLGVGQAARKAGDASEALEAAGLALRSARAVKDARRPFLILVAAGQLAGLDPFASQSALSEAFGEFNRQEDAALRNVSWRQKVELGPLAQKFPLNVEGVEFGFGPAFRSAIPESLDDAFSLAKSLKNEGLRARSLVEIGRATLPAAAAPAQGKETVIRVGEDGMRKSAARTVMPSYPEEAKKGGQQGVAVVEAQYNGAGDVTEASVLEAPAPSIGEAVVGAVKRWKFKPSSLNGQPISVRGKLTFYFVLEKGGAGRVENPKQFQ